MSTGTDWPVDEMADLLSRYFDGVTEEQLIDKYQDIYDPASRTLHYEGGRGGGPYYLRVTGWEEDGRAGSPSTMRSTALPPASPMRQRLSAHRAAA